MTSSFLIADEDRNFREALAIALRLDGHDVVAVGSEEALGLLEARRFDCCVVSAHLPQAGALLEAAVAAGARTVATGPYADLLAATCARHPRAAMLAKPFTAFELLRLLVGPARAAG